MKLIMKGDHLMKNFLSLLLAFFMLSLTLVGCETSITNATNPTNKADDSNETLMRFDTNDLKINNQVTNNAEDANEEHIQITDDPKYYSSNANYSYLNDYSVICGNDEEYYVYIRAWDAYRKITIPNLFNRKGPCFDPTSAMINENTATIAIYDYNDSMATVTVFHLNKHNEDVESYTTVLKSKFYTRLLSTAFVNVANENTICFFGLTEPTLYPNSEKEPSFIKIITKDGGKTWSSEETLLPNVTAKNTLTIAKFASNTVGIISYAYVANQDVHSGEFHSEWDDIFDGTYITTDGGLSWKRISLEYDYKFGVRDYEYRNIIRAAKVIYFSKYDSNKTYRLGFAINNDSNGYFISEDFINWELPIGK